MRELTMVSMIIAMTKQAVTDRKGVTALEYGIIAGVLAVAVLAAFNTLGTKLQTFFSALTL
jgi:pilus assembly protein Flp/PilA